MDKVLIIVPAFKESKVIAKTVKEIQDCGLPVSVLVVDDGSEDDTAAKARQAGADVVRLPFNLGIGGAVQTGYRYAGDHDYEIAVQIDGDGQHDPSFLEVLLRPLMQGKADITIGSRFLPPNLGYRSSWVRRIGIHFFANLISLLCGVRITDPTSGFRACNKRMIKLFAKYYPYDFPEPEAIAVARRYNARVMEVPVKMRAREHGVSSIRYLQTLHYMIKVTFAIFLDKLKRRREID